VLAASKPANRAGRQRYIRPRYIEGISASTFVSRTPKDPGSRQGLVCSAAPPQKKVKRQNAKVTGRTSRTYGETQCCSLRRTGR
jgi:hypothetical protein